MDCNSRLGGRKSRTGASERAVEDLVWVFWLDGDYDDDARGRPTPSKNSLNPDLFLFFPSLSKKNSSYVAAAYVKWIEAAGGRAVPIRFYVSDGELRRLFDSVNGLIFPGEFFLSFFPFFFLLFFSLSLVREEKTCSPSSLLSISLSLLVLSRFFQGDSPVSTLLFSSIWGTGGEGAVREKLFRLSSTKKPRQKKKNSKNVQISTSTTPTSRPPPSSTTGPSSPTTPVAPSRSGEPASGTSCFKSS